MTAGPHAVAVMLTVVLVGAHCPAWAQAGWYFTPSLSLTESFDDNIFGSISNAQPDFISRFSPGFQSGYRSDPFTLLFNGGFDAEVFAQNTELTDATSGWRLGLSSAYLGGRPLTLGFAMNYMETRSLSTLTQSLTQSALANPNQPSSTNTVQFGRLKTTMLNASPSGAYQFDPLTSATAAYLYTHSTQEGGVPNTGHQVPLGLSRKFTSLDTASLNYRLDIFESPGSPSTISHAVTVGWMRQLTQHTTLSFSGGPRFSDGTVSPEISASLAHQFKVFDEMARASVSYARSEGFVIGQAGSVNTETYSGTVGVEPLRSLQASLGASLTKLSGGTTPDTTTYAVTAGASYQILRWLAARASYSFTFQEQSVGNVRHNILSISLDVSYPTRIDQ